MLKLSFLKNPLVVIASIFIGGFIGVNFPDLALVLSPFGNMYLNLLQMVVIPILVSSIIASTGNLMINSSRTLIRNILFYFVITIFLTALFGILAGLAGQPGENLSQESKDTLGEYVQTSSFKQSRVLEVNIFSETDEVEEEGSPIIDFITGIIPQNIFRALTQGKAMEVVFFTILLGISIGLLKTNESKNILSVASSIFISFQKIMNTTIYFLPFGLMFLISAQIQEVGIGLVYPMIKLIVVFYIAGTVVLIVNTLIIGYRAKAGPIETIRALGDSMMIAFFTRNSLASIPATVMGLEQRLKFERSTCNLLVPLGISLGRYGNIFYFAVASIFVLQLYEVDYGMVDIGIVFLGSVLAGTATSGATGFSTLPLIAIVLTPLGIPAEVVLLLLFAIDAIVDPMRTLLIVHTNAMTTALVSEIYVDAGKREHDIYKDTII